MPERFFLYLFVMAGVTYALRMLPLVLFRKKITNRFLQSFCAYVPYAVLGAMTIPAIFSSTGSLPASVVGFLCAFCVAWKVNGVLAPAIAAVLGALATQLIMML